MCEVLEVPRSTYYKKLKPITSNREKENREYKKLIFFTTTDINQKWVADITYIHTIKDGWCYLATVLDLHTKKVIGYCFSKKMDTTIVIEALRRAYQKQRPENFVILRICKSCKGTENQGFL